MEIRLEDIEKIIDRFEAGVLTSLELELGDLKLRLGKEAYQVNASTGESIYLEKTEDNESQQEAAQKVTSGRAVKAPLVGTFYAAASPGAEPYVKPGDRVKAGDVLGLIEAMKIMNEIQSPVNGVVTEISAKDGEFVAFDEVLFVLKED